MFATTSLGIAQRRHLMMYSETADVYMNLFRSYMAVGNVAPAAECLQHAEEIVHFQLGSNHPMLIDIHLEVARM